MASYLALVQAFTKNPTLDIIIILFFLAAGFFLGTMRGRAKLFSFLFGTYISLLATPLIVRMLSTSRGARNISIYIILVLVAAFICDRIVFVTSHRSSFRWWQAFCISFLSVGLFVSGALNLKLAQGIVDFSPITLTLFAGQGAYLFWALAPLMGLILFARR